MTPATLSYHYLWKFSIFLKLSVTVVFFELFIFLNSQIEFSANHVRVFAVMANRGIGWQILLRFSRRYHSLLTFPNSSNMHSLSAVLD